MYHFHLTKYWFDRFKDGSKTVEYRFYTERFKKQIYKDFGTNLPCKDFGTNLPWSCARLYCGYPKSGDSSRILTAVVREIRFPLFYQLPVDVRDFMIKNCKQQIFDDSVFIAFVLHVVRD